MGRIAVIGCGNWGKNHVRNWHELGHLAAICDADAERLATISKPYPDAMITESLSDVLENPDIQGVVVATPPVTHVEIARRALEAGKDVLAEKPLAMTAGEGQSLVDIARERGRILMVGHVLEFHPAVRALHELVGSGELGRVQYVYSNRLNLGTIRSEENVLWSFAPHDVALLLRILGRSPLSLACHGAGYINRAVADTTLTTLHFDDDVLAHIHVSWLHPVKEHRFVVVGDRHMAVFDDTQEWDQKLVLYPHRVDWREGRHPIASKAPGKPVPLDPSEPLKEECIHFMECIESRTPPLTDGQSGVRVLEILEAAQASLQQAGEKVPIRPERMTAAPSWFIHPTAVVDDGAQLGAGTKIWHYSHIMGGSQLGERCILGQNVFVAKGVRIGNGVKIQNNVSVYEGVTLEDDVFCGPSMVFTNVINPRSHVERKTEFRPTHVGRGATLGANSTILCGTTVGDYALVGAGAVVTKDVAAFAIVTGCPARQTGWVCACGETLDVSGDSVVCSACSAEYNLEDQQLRAMNQA